MSIVPSHVPYASSPVMTEIIVRFRAPAPPLQPFLSAYYEIETMPGMVLEDWLHPEWANIRMTLDSHWILGCDDSGAPAAQGSGCVLQGPTSRSTYVKGSGQTFGIGILPPGWSRLWRLDASLLANRVVPLADVIGAPDATAFENDLRAAANIDARKAICDQLLLDRIASATPDPMAAKIDSLFQILIDPANATVDQISSTLGLPQARLARLCKRGFGFPPKLLLRRQRFLRMLGTLHARPYGEWRDFIDPQYVDQSHMVRDFQHFLGMSPRAYFAQPRPILAAAAKARAEMFGQPLQGLHAPKGKAAR